MQCFLFEYGSFRVRTRTIAFSISKGMNDKLQTSKETFDLFRKKMKTKQNYFILSTKEAVKVYNKFAKKKKRVRALIHST